MLNTKGWNGWLCELDGCGPHVGVEFCFDDFHLLLVCELFCVGVGVGFDCVEFDCVGVLVFVFALFAFVLVFVVALVAGGVCHLLRNEMSGCLGVWFLLHLADTHCGGGSCHCGWC